MQRCLWLLRRLDVDIDQGERSVIRLGVQLLGWLLLGLNYRRFWWDDTFVGWVEEFPPRWRLLFYRHGVGIVQRFTATDARWHRKIPLHHFPRTY